MEDIEVKQLIGGHTGSVLCVTVNKNSQIISGGEYSELAQWSSTGSLIKTWKICDDDIDITSIVCSRIDPNQCYVAGCNSVYTVKLNQPDTLPRSVISYGNDSDDNEINQISLNADENLLALADDSGHVKVFTVSDFSLYRTLRAHTNITSSVCFSSNGDLFSASYDFDVIKWNVRKSRSAAVVNTKTITDDNADVESGCFSVSPSFVHSLDVSSDGALLACATENSLIHIFDLSRNTLHYTTSLRGHKQGVSKVAFLDYSGGNGTGTCNGGSSTGGSYLISSGNDNRILLWDIKQVLQLGHAFTNTGSNQTDKTRRTKRTSATKKPQDCSVVKIEPSRIVEHSDKINAIATGELNSKPYVIVADNSSILTCLTIV